MGARQNLNTSVRPGCDVHLCVTSGTAVGSRGEGAPRGGQAYSLNGENAHYGTPVNPACPDRVPGGSSSGSAVRPC